MPNLPAPKAGTPGYDPAVVTALINQFGAKPTFGGDTYGGGKDLLRFAQYAFMAQQLKDPSYEKIRDAVVGALQNWLTYTPGEANKFFTAYPHAKALVGFAIKADYRSGELGNVVDRVRVAAVEDDGRVDVRV